MGNPIPPAGDAEIENGTFDGSSYWQRRAPWLIYGGKAHASWTRYLVDTNLWQDTSLELNVNYILEFDVSNVSMDPACCLYARLGGPGGSKSSKIKTAGHKKVTLNYNGYGQWIVFFIYNTIYYPGYLDVDNVSLLNVAWYPAEQLALFTQPDAFFDDLYLGDGYHNTRYASNFDKSNILVAYDSDDF